MPSCRKLTYSWWFDSKIRSVSIFFNPVFWCCLVDEVWWFLKIRHKHDKHCISSLFFGFTMISVTCLVLIPCSCFRVYFLWLLFFIIINAGNRYSFYYHTLRKVPKDITTTWKFCEWQLSIPLFLFFLRCHVFSFRLYVTNLKKLWPVDSFLTCRTHDKGPVIIYVVIYLCVY